jgi:hypothetical protein
MRILTLFILFIGILPICGQDARFFDALGAVESSNNPKAYNKLEKAIGIYQIRPAYFKDAQEFNWLLKEYKHEDCYSPVISRKVVSAYMARYCKEKTYENMSRCHNSGPNWKNKTNLTNNYWNKMKKELTKH